LGTVIVGVALFWSAGRVDWWAGWALVVLLLSWSAATAVVVLRVNPDLLAERLGPRKGAKKLDTAILSVVGVATLARLVIAGLDQRYGWAGDFSPAWQIAALGMCVLGYALVVWATASNTYFSQVVPLQTERGHAVATSGPYRFVRQPAYIGTILFELAAPAFWIPGWR
jgi:protein-S-isoprenylcysteine O-methyltransferase Ste14